MIKKRRKKKKRWKSKMVARRAFKNWTGGMSLRLVYFKSYLNWRKGEKTSFRGKARVQPRAVAEKEVESNPLVLYFHLHTLEITLEISREKFLISTRNRYSLFLFPSFAQRLNALHYYPPPLLFFFALISVLETRS